MWADPLALLRASPCLGLPDTVADPDLAADESAVAQLLYSHACRRWLPAAQLAPEVAADMSAGGGEGGGSNSDSDDGGAGGGGAGSDVKQAVASPAEAGQRAVSRLCSALRKWLQEAEEEVGGGADGAAAVAQLRAALAAQPLGALARRALSLGLFARASHPLLRLSVSSLQAASPTISAGGGGAGKRRQLAALRVHDVTTRRHDTSRHDVVFCLELPGPEPSAVADQRVGGTEAAAPFLLASLAPGAGILPTSCLISGATGCAGTRAGAATDAEVGHEFARVLVAEEVLAWQPLRAVERGAERESPGGVVGLVAGIFGRLRQGLGV